MSYSRVITLAAIATLVVAVLAVPRRSGLVLTPTESSKPEAPDPTASVTVAVPPVRPPALAPAATPIAKSAATAHPEPSLKNTPAEAIQNPVATASRRPTASSPVVETHDTASFSGPHSTSAPATMTASAPAPAATMTNAVAQVTITGCLEPGASKDRFRLTDTEGTDAPKARSWRSGFLKKHSTPVDLVGAADPGALQKQIGKRVAVTGVQTNRDLNVGSVRVISPSCN